MLKPANKFWFALAFMAAQLQGCASSNPYYNPNKSHHRPDGFVNSDGTIVSKPMEDLIRWYRERFGQSLPPPPGEFRANYEAFPVTPFDSKQVSALGPSTATWLGHATVLIRHAGMTVITDPHLSLRAFPVQWAGPNRKVRSPARVEDLPAIDVVMISHNHYDHMDYGTLMDIAARNPKAQFLVPLGVEVTLKSWGIQNVKALDWWDSATVGSSQFYLVPAYHWSARTLTDRNASLWGGWVMHHPTFRFFFSGDTGYSSDFKEIGRLLGPFDLSAIAVGAYEPRWFMKAQHINPDEAAQIHKDTRTRQTLGIHWGTFELTDEPLDQPIGDVEKARKTHKLTENEFRVVNHGESFKLPLIGGSATGN